MLINKNRKQNLLVKREKLQLQGTNNSCKLSSSDEPPLMMDGVSGFGVFLGVSTFFHLFSCY